MQSGVIEQPLHLTYQRFDVVSTTQVGNVCFDFMVRVKSCTNEASCCIGLDLSAL